MTVAKRKHHTRPASRGFDAERSASGVHRDWLASCAGKARYTSEAAARAAIGLQLGAPALDVYPCARHCGGWHLTERRPVGTKKAAPPVHILAFVCAACRARHASVAASAVPWTPERRRAALLELDPLAIRDGWSVGADDDHCPACAAALGLETLRGAA